MPQVQINDIEMDTNAHLIKVGDKAPNFSLTDKGLNEITLKQCAGMPVLLNSYPSIDTQTCNQSIKVFIKKTSHIDKLVILGVSMDLPFAIERAHLKENEDNTLPILLLSDFRTRQFATDYGLTIVNGPLAGLLSRAVLILDEEHKVVYTERVNDITQEPNYEAALASLESL